MTSLRLSDFVAASDRCHYSAPSIVQPRPDAPHGHDFCEVFWITAGNGIHWINGGRREIGPGTMVFIRAADRHSFSCASAAKPLRMVNVAFSGRIWQRLRDRYALGDRFDRSLEEPIVLNLTAVQRVAVNAAADELRAGRRHLAATDRFLLNISYATEGPLALESDAVATPPWLTQLCEMLTAAGEDIPVDTRALAERAGRTPAHVARSVRHYLGRTPTDLLNDAKLARAAYRLAGGVDDILSISLDCGYGNLSHFYQRFRQKYHTTPRQFRLRHRRIVRPN